MILQALYGRYLRQVSQGDKDAPPFGFGPAPMHFALVLDGNGQVVDVDDLRITVQNRQRARELIVPKDFEDRTSGDEAPRALWDNAEYVLGHFPGNPRRAAKRFAT